MSTHTAAIDWTLDGDFKRGRYSRAHTIRFDGGIAVQGSSSPAAVPLPWSVEQAVDPEEMLVAALSACHMLTFLDLARRAGWSIERYSDNAEGRMDKGEDGRVWIAAVTLSPEIGWTGPAPSPGELDALHHEAHQACFIANSVKTSVTIKP